MTKRSFQGAMAAHVARRTRLSLIDANSEINTGPLLASDWWPHLWTHRVHGQKTFERDGRTLGDTLAWYDRQISEGWESLAWSHEQRGKIERSPDGKWKQTVFLSKNRKWSIAIGPISGKKGEVKAIDSATCARLRFNKMVLIGDDDIAEITSFRIDNKDLPIPVFETVEINGKLLKQTEFSGSTIAASAVAYVHIGLRFFRDGSWCAYLRGTLE